MAADSRSLDRAAGITVGGSAWWGRADIGLGDKIENKTDELTGKEGISKATDDKELEAAGHGDRAKGSLKQAGEKITDVLKS